MNTDWMSFLNLEDNCNNYNIENSEINDSRLSFNFNSDFEFNSDFVEPFNIKNSFIYNSDITDSSITNSNIFDSVITDSSITNSVIKNTTITNSTIVQNKEENKEEKVKGKRGRKRKLEGSTIKAEEFKRVKKSEYLSLNDVFPTSLGSILDLNTILTEDQQKMNINTCRINTTLINYLKDVKCIKLKNSNTYIFSSNDLFCPVTFSNTNIARYTRSLVYGKDYFGYSSHFARYLTTEGIRVLIKLFKKNKNYLTDKIEYLNILEHLSHHLDKNNFESKIELEVKNKKEHTITNLNTKVEKEVEKEVEVEIKNKTKLWNSRYESLKKYIEKHKQKELYFSRSDPENYYLMKWCINQKYRYNKKDLPLSRIRKLTSLRSFHWGSYTDPNEKNTKSSWLDMYNELKKYLQSINNVSLFFNRSDKKNSKLYNWCNCQKINIKHKKMSIKHYNMLSELPGFHWGNYKI